MKKRQIIQSIRRSVDKLTPDVYQYVANAPVQKLPFHGAITAQPKQDQTDSKRKISPVLRLAPVFALLALVLFSFTMWKQLMTVSGVVGLDVNPSIQIDVNRFDRVIDVKPLNNDAIPIIHGIAYKQVKLEYVVRSLVGSMYYHGYLQDPESAILISVESRDTKKAAFLKKQVTIEISELVSLDTSQVYSQIIPIEQIDKRPEQEGVSFGVLNLARMAQEKYPEYSMEELFSLPVSVLYEMAHSEPGTYQPDLDLPEDCGGDNNPCRITLPFIMSPDGTEIPHATPTPTSPGYNDDDDGFDLDDWWDDLWDDDDDDEWDDD